MILVLAAINAVRPIYGYVVAVSIGAVTATTATTTAALYLLSFAVVAQGRAPIKGDMGARPIFGKYSKMIHTMQSCKFYGIGHKH